MQLIDRITSRTTMLIATAWLLFLTNPLWSQSSEPAASYIFPAGAQRGQTVDLVVGGLFLLDSPWFEMIGPRIEAPKRLPTGETVWFDGPQLVGQMSLEPEDYPKDHTGEVSVADSAPLGIRHWRVWTSQGTTAARMFVVGDLPEIVEQEIAGDPIPTEVTLPITINGRVFPRSDVDIWTFPAKYGESYTIDVSAKELQSPLDARIELRVDGNAIAEDIGTQTTDPLIQFTAAHDGNYEVRIHDVGYAGAQPFVYRLTIRRGTHVVWIYPLGADRRENAEFEVGLAPNDVNPPKGAAPKTTYVSVDLNKPARNYVQQPLTVDCQESQPVRFEISDLQERLETEPNNVPRDVHPFVAPVMLNGRIGQPGDEDLWPIACKSGQRLELRLSAGRLGSPLQPELAILDADGNQVAPAPGEPPSGDVPSADEFVSFTPPDDGLYWVRIRDHFASRGGPAFAYRPHSPSRTWGPTMRRYMPVAFIGIHLQLNVVTTRGQ
jgi:hypothetical protein